MVTLFSFEFTADKQEEFLKEAILINPNNDTAHNNLGVLYYDQNRYDEAEKEYDIAIRLNPNNRSTIKNLRTLKENMKPKKWFS